MIFFFFVLDPHQLLCLRRLGQYPSYLHLADKSVYPAANITFRHEFDVRIITDGEHHVLDQLPIEYSSFIEEIPTNPHKPIELGFQAQEYLSTQLDKNYDLYVYLEDDLLIHDPLFFHKINWYNSITDLKQLLLPQRFEYSRRPNIVEPYEMYKVFLIIKFFDFISYMPKCCSPK